MRTHPKQIAVTIALALPLAACGDDDKGGSTDGTVPAGVVHVIVDDSLDFDSDEYTAEAGVVRFFYEGGSLQHSLVVDGYEFEMRLLIQGDSDEGSLTLQAGEYQMFCDIAGHRVAGMEATLVVE